jgi:hypothetical protein
MAVKATRDPGEEILAYLEAHQAAADSLEGIVAWWLPRQRYVEARDLIQESLNRLVARGLIKTTRLPDGTVLYCKAAPEELR